MNEQQHKAWDEAATKSWPSENSWERYFEQQRRQLRADVRQAGEQIVDGLATAFRNEKRKFEVHCDRLQARMQDETTALVNEVRKEVRHELALLARERAAMVAEVKDLEIKRLRLVSGGS